MRFVGKVAIVTGAAYGIGRAAALGFAAEGAMVTIADVNVKGLEVTAAMIETAGGQCLVCPTDVANEAQVDLMVEKTVATFGAVHILVNNAGVGQFNPFPTLSVEEWDHVMNVNAKGIFLCSKAVVHHMIEQQYGRIVNVTSIMAEFAGIAQSAYNASKGAAKMLTQGMAKDLAEMNIFVNAVAPGMVVTGLTETMFENDEQRAWFEEKIPLRRIGTPEDLAPPILFLASDEASYITGATLRVDGGMTCAMS